MPGDITSKIKHVKNFKLSSLLYNLIVCLVVAAVLSMVSTTGAIVVSSLLFITGFIPRKMEIGILKNEVIVTLFSNDLQENLYPANEFYKACNVDPGVAIDKATVEVPQAGTPPAVIKNPQTLPVPARIRADDKKSYDVDMYVTEPDIVTDVNQAIVSYDKRSAILKDHVSVLNTRIADELMYLFSPSLSSNIKRTSGTGNTGSLYAGMTGTRKEITYQDIIDVATLMDRMEIPDDGQRRVLLYTDQVAEIKKIAEFRDFDKSGVVGQLASGAIGKLQGFTVYKRSRSPLFTTGAVKKTFGAAVGATDHISALFFHPSFLRYAEGAVKIYYEAGKVGYQGDMMNAAIRGGGMISRLDQKGVISLVQQA
jgi:hypothetical protein